MLVGCFIGSSSVAEAEEEDSVEPADSVVPDDEAESEVLCVVLFEEWLAQPQMNTAIMQNARTKQSKRFMINSPYILNGFCL
jgi:hypothetical protein